MSLDFWTRFLGAVVLFIVLGALAEYLRHRWEMRAWRRRMQFDDDDDTRLARLRRLE